MTARALGLAPCTGSASERRAAARTAVVWEALRRPGPASTEHRARRPRHRRRHRRVRGPARRARPPGHRRRPQPRRPGRPRPPGPRARRRPGHRPAGRPADLLDAGRPGQRRPGALPRRARGRRRPRRRAGHDPRGAAPRRRPQPARRPAARRRRRPGDGRPLRPGPGAARRPSRPAAPAAPGSRFTARRAHRRCSPRPASRSTAVHGVRVFADLVPGSLLDLEPGATAALVELEQAVAERPEYLPLATQLHVLATR